MINSAIFSFDDKLGRSIAEKNFDHVINNFDPETWVGNGPEVLSNLVKKMCNTTDRLQMTRENCQGFEVHRYEECYAIGGHEWGKLFNLQDFDEVMSRTNNSFAIHFWNYLSKNVKVLTQSNQPYAHIARQYCPKVIRVAGEYF